MKLLLASVLAVGLSSSSLADIMYNNTSPDPPSAYGNLDRDAVMLDDVLIPSTRTNGNQRLYVTRIEAKIFAPRAGSYDVKAWAAVASFNDGPTPVLPPALIRTVNMQFSPNETRTLAIGDGQHQLFSTSLLSIINGNVNYGAFFFGLSFSSNAQNIGWVQGDGPDFNLNGFWSYYAAGDNRNQFRRFAGNYRSSFNLKIEGYIVPEPSALIALAAGLALYLKRRR